MREFGERLPPPREELGEAVCQHTGASYVLDDNQLIKHIELNEGIDLL